MSVGFILSQAGAKMGMNPNATTSRVVLLRFLNEAARELYTQSDMPGSLWEQYFKINGNQTISMPHYVGEVRAVREANNQTIWSINQMRPRYNQFNWTDNWRNYRLKNTQALMNAVVNQSVGVISVSVIETPNIIVTVSGPTEDASEISENVTMSALSINTVNQFLDYTSVKKDRINTCDVTLSDIDEAVLTVIPNNQLQASYQILDISLCPWLAQSGSVQDHYAEILYKKTLPVFQNDGDEFPAQGYDDILVNKILQLWNEEQGKGDVAAAYDAKATRTLARKTENKNRATEDSIALVANPHDTLLPRVRSGRRTYRGGRYN